MTNHALDQVMGQPEACLSPALAIAERPPAEEESESDPAKEQEHVERPPCACTEDHRRQNELDPRHEREKATAQGEGFHSLRLDDTPEELASSLMAYLLRLKPQGSVEETLFEESPCADGEHALRPGREQPERDYRQQEQRPGEEPSLVESPFERPATHHPPGEQQQKVLDGMRTNESKEVARQACLAHLAPDACAGWQAQEPATVEPHRAETLVQDGRPRPCLAPLGDVGRAKYLVHLCHMQLFEL